MSDLIQRLRATRRFGPDDFEMLREAADQLEANAALIALLRASLRKAEDEVEGLRRDAERYRWIRDVLRLDDVRWMNVTNWNQANISAEIWDQEIDAALANQKEG